jgi:hypothetical protein
MSEMDSFPGDYQAGRCHANLEMKTDYDLQQTCHGGQLSPMAQFSHFPTFALAFKYCGLSQKSMFACVLNTRHESCCSTLHTTLVIPVILGVLNLLAAWRTFVITAGDVHDLRRYMMFYRSVASQDCPFRERNGTIQFKHHSTFTISMNKFLQLDHPFLKYRIQSLTIDSPQNFMDSGQEFIRFIE